MSRYPSTTLRRVPVYIEWKVTPVTADDTVVFASSLESALNRRTGEGFALSHMFQYNTNDMVLVHQRTSLADGLPSAVEESESKH
jgi:hypothetical protein